MNTKNKPVKPRKMWACSEASKSVGCFKKSTPLFPRPVLVIDLSPESVKKLSDKIGSAANSWLSGKNSDRSLEHLIIAAIGIKATKPRKSNKGVSP